MESDPHIVLLQTPKSTMIMETLCSLSRPLCKYNTTKAYINGNSNITAAPSPSSWLSSSTSLSSRLNDSSGTSSISSSSSSSLQDESVTGGSQILGLSQPRDIRRPELRAGENAWSAANGPDVTLSKRRPWASADGLDLPLGRQHRQLQGSADSRGTGLLIQHRQGQGSTYSRRSVLSQHRLGRASVPDLPSSQRPRRMTIAAQYVSDVDNNATAAQYVQDVNNTAVPPPCHTATSTRHNGCLCCRSSYADTAAKYGDYRNPRQYHESSTNGEIKPNNNHRSDFMESSSFQYYYPRFLVYNCGFTLVLAFLLLILPLILPAIPPPPSELLLFLPFVILLVLLMLAFMYSPSRIPYHELRLQLPGVSANIDPP